MSDQDRAAAPNGAAADEPLTPEIIDEAVAAASAGSADLSVEDIIEQLERVTAERDGHFDARARLQAEFDNYRKRVSAQQVEQAERANESLVGKLLPVLDACDAALAHNVEGVEPIATQLIAVLEREGLQRLAAKDAPFDPEFHEAVMHEEGDGGAATVVEVFRTGYTWKNRVLRPAMVKVRG